MIKPVFIFSLPRSGSTLAQRILTRTSGVSSASEPWLLLPYIYTLRSQGQFSEYWHGRTVEAISDFCDVLPDGKNTYYKELRKFVTHLYQDAAGDGAVYFLDKTPRYHLVVNEIIDIFPDAKFIFLWRNPLAVASSIMDTWGKGRWNLHSYKIDLYSGLSSLTEAFEKHKNKVHAVRYEDLVTNPVQSWQGIMDYLELPFDQEMIEEFSDVKLQGRMGDPTGTKLYTTGTKFNY